MNLIGALPLIAFVSLVFLGALVWFGLKSSGCTRTTRLLGGTTLAVFCLAIGGWQFFRNETWRLKHASDPQTIQRWAEDLLEAHRLDPNPYWDREGTNVPPGLRHVFRVRPFVLMDPGDDHVLVSWGRGYPVMAVGSRAYVETNSNSEVWIPGFYLEYGD